VGKNLINRLRPSPAHQGATRLLQELATEVITAEGRALDLQWELRAALDVLTAHRAAFRLRTEARSLSERDDQRVVEERRLFTHPEPESLTPDERNWADVLGLVSDFTEQCEAAQLKAKAARLQYETQRRVMRHQEAFHHGND
jgi:hypothetical protein